MKVAHFAPYAPGRSGLYEAARDFVIADRRAGRDAVLVDTGMSIDNGPETRHVGDIDERGGSLVIAEDYEAARDADVLVFHSTPTLESGVWDLGIPIVVMLHGRPKACFLDELAWTNGTRSYSFYAELGRRESVSALVSMWQEHIPYWDAVMPPGKVRCIAPPVDEARFSPSGFVREFDPVLRGEFNVLICDAWRRDEGIFDVLNACCHLAARGEMRGRVRIHTYGIEVRDGPDGTLTHSAALLPLFERLNDLGALGERCCRQPRMDEAYRAADVVVTAHRIGVRTIIESLSCGTPVVARSGCIYTPWAADPEDPRAFAEEISRCLLAADKGVNAEPFSLSRCADAMRSIYEEVTKSAKALVGAA